MNTVTPASKNKKALILFSSPNKNGFTRKLLEALLFELGELESCIVTEEISIFNTDILPCDDCKACESGECPKNGDGMDELIEKFHQADIIIAATPIYFNCVPAKFKAIFDRLQQLFVKKFFLKNPEFTEKKLGILLSCAGSKNPFATTSINAMFDMFFKSLNADFISHISLSDTDNNPQTSIPETELTKIKQAIEEM